MPPANLHRGRDAHNRHPPPSGGAGWTQSAGSFYSADQRLRYFQENVLTGGSSVGKQGVWKEYRYDPLGRRVLVRGDQLLWELRLDSKPGANLEAAYTTGPYHGRASYFHAGGIDRPLVIRKEGQPTIIVHENRSAPKSKSGSGHDLILRRERSCF